jgi:hypothetical protein
MNTPQAQTTRFPGSGRAFCPPGAVFEAKRALFGLGMAAPFRPGCSMDAAGCSLRPPGCPMDGAGCPRRGAGKPFHRAGCSFHRPGCRPISRREHPGAFRERPAAFREDPAPGNGHPRAGRDITARSSEHPGASGVFSAARCEPGRADLPVGPNCPASASAARRAAARGVINLAALVGGTIGAARQRRPTEHQPP